MAKGTSCMQTQDSLLSWLEAFAKVSGASREHSVLLKLDGHSSRDCAAVRGRAKELGVELWQLVSHTTSRQCEVDTHLAAPLKRAISKKYTEACSRAPSRKTFPLHEYVRLVVDAALEIHDKPYLSHAFVDTSFYDPALKGPNKAQMLSRLPKANATVESELARAAREEARAKALTLAHHRARPDEPDGAIVATPPPPKKSRKHDKPLFLTGPEYMAECTAWAASPEGIVKAAKAEKAAAAKRRKLGVAGQPAAGDAPAAAGAGQGVVRRACTTCGVLGNRSDNLRFHPEYQRVAAPSRAAATAVNSDSEAEDDGAEDTDSDAEDTPVNQQVPALPRGVKRGAGAAGGGAKRGRTE